ncbi:glucosyltransferase domain-containing protein [Rouxiella sp. T17]|uniref:glucosyltransferase domain-containing protein n=1 Tax=Rouxiella sp. T17 TaxID=3085684 RepID=UPI002FC70A4B
MTNVLVNEPVVRRHQQILMTFIIGLLATVPLWTNKIYYIDDYFRLFTGDSHYWISNGRPLTTVLNVIMRFSTVSTDISPLPLLLGILILSCASVVYCEKLSLPLKGYWQCVPPLFILLNPFLAQSMLFTYDSLTILLSAALAMTASLNFGRIKGPIKGRITFTSVSLTTVLMLSVFTTYQIGINIYFGLVILVATTRWATGEPIGAYLLEKCACSLAAIVIYRYLIVTITVHDPYTLSHSGILTPSKDAAVAVLNNVRILYLTFASAFPGYRLLFVILPLIVSYTGLWVLYQRHRRHKSQSLPNSAVSVIVLSVIPIMMMLIVPGLSSVLTSPVYYPRVLSAWGCLNLFCFCITVMAYPTLGRWITGLYLICLFYCLIVMLTMFNAVVNEQQHMLSIAQHMKIDLALLPPSQVKHIAIIDQPSASPIVRVAKGALPIIGLLKSNLDNKSNSWAFESILTLEGIIIPPKITATAEMKAFIPQQYVSQSCDYRLFIYEGTAVFDLRNLHTTLKCR